MKNIQDDIDNIMDNFDFRKVHEVMTMLNWKWGLSPEVPTESEIRANARRKMKRAVEETQRLKLNEYSCESGGLRVDVTVDNDIFISLSFVLTSWDNYL